MSFNSLNMPYSIFPNQAPQNTAGMPYSIYQPPPAPIQPAAQSSNLVWVSTPSPTPIIDSLYGSTHTSPPPTGHWARK